jgi:hypothetical protein
LVSNFEDVIRSKCNCWPLLNRLPSNTDYRMNRYFRTSLRSHQKSGGAPRASYFPAESDWIWQCRRRVKDGEAGLSKIPAS